MLWMCCCVCMQEERFMQGYRHGSDLVPPEEVAADGSVTNEMAQKWQQLQQLQVSASRG